MNKKDTLDFLNRLAEGIASTFGSNCETVIHDMKNNQHSIVTIYNGHVTGRKVGDSFDILGNKIDISNSLVNETDFVNCHGITQEGKLIKSSTFQISGKDFRYAFGINFDYTFFSFAETSIKELIAVGAGLAESISESVDNQLKSIFDECIKTTGKSPLMLNKDERVRLVALLKEKNAFSFQKSIPYISERLNISRYTIYNYLKKINGND